MHAAPAVSCAKLCEEPHTSIQVQRRQSGIPCAMVLRLMPCSPRRRIRLVTVAAGLMALPIRSDRSRHRQLDTSNGCRDHTVLPYALAPFVRAPLLAHGKPPCEHLRADAAASTASPPTFVTTRDRPSCRERTGRAGSADLPDEGSGIFFREGLDRFWVICPSGGSLRGRSQIQPSLRAQRSNPSSRKGSMDCFVANAPRNDEKAAPLRSRNARAAAALRPRSRR
jgi:hypothetical protein